MKKRYLKFKRIYLIIIEDFFVIIVVLSIILVYYCLNYNVLVSFLIKYYREEFDVGNIS